MTEEATKRRRAGGRAGNKERARRAERDRARAAASTGDLRKP